ncbi:MAG TPA: D-2-hydroxyacid dehydrogenase [Pseudolabrys sp.]|nr:D-2-hydroxyacid dehydrogenase [Pseudolabrys sp.]
MKVLVLDSGAHINIADMRREFPETEFFGTKTEVEALVVCADCDVLVCISHEATERLIAAMPKLGYIFSLTTGVDHLRTLKALSSSVRITNARGIHGPQMAELAFLYMLGFTRSIRTLARNQADRIWDRWPQPLLHGKTVVVVGLGAIAEALVARCNAFGMTVHGVSDARASFPGCETIYRRADLKAAAARADFMIILVPLDDRSRGMIDASVFAAMKPTAYLINIARGAVVDEAAMIAALRDGQIAGAGLDVFTHEPLPADNPLWAMDNVMITPRIGGMSDCYAEQIFPLAVHNLHAWKAGRQDDLRNLVR